jgi:predicted RNase H-like nuclease (RuvC/YqgF family)
MSVFKSFTSNLSAPEQQLKRILKSCEAFTPEVIEAKTAELAQLDASIAQCIQQCDKERAEIETLRDTTIPNSQSHLQYILSEVRELRALLLIQVDNQHTLRTEVEQYRQELQVLENQAAAFRQEFKQECTELMAQLGKVQARHSDKFFVVVSNSV